MEERKTIFILILILLSITRTLNSECQNGGIPILVRQKTKPYSIHYQCLCPFSYYGQTCGNLRSIYCRFNNQKLLKYNPKISLKADLEFQLQCYLKKFPQSQLDNNKTINNFYRLPLSTQQVKKQLKQQNYYFDQDYNIVWANVTNIFDSNGQIMRNLTDFRTDEQILDKYPHYQFDYNGSFFGIPLLHEEIKYKLQVNYVKNQSLSLQMPSIQWNDQLTFDNKTKKVGRFSINIDKSWQEFQVSRIQLLLSMVYGNLSIKLHHRLGMNSAKWRIFDPNFTKGQIISYSTHKVPSSLLVILAFLFLFGSISGGRLALKYYKKWRNKKQIKQMDEQNAANIQQGEESDIYENK